jgi:hypothetical protein
MLYIGMMVMKVVIVMVIVGRRWYGNYGSNNKDGASDWTSNTKGEDEKYFLLFFLPIFR